MSNNPAQMKKTQRNRHFVTAGAIFLASSLLSGCSSVPDWANPVEWYDGVSGMIYGDSKPESIAATDIRTPQKTLGKGKKFPNLSSVPERPSTTTVEGRKSLAKRLTADRANAKYSKEVIQRQTPQSTILPSLPPAPRLDKAAQTMKSESKPQIIPPPSTLPQLSAPAASASLGPTPLSRPPNFASAPPKALPTVPPGAEVRSLATRPSPSRRSVARVGNPSFGSPPADIAAAFNTGRPPAISGDTLRSPLTPIAGTWAAQAVTGGGPVGIIRFRAGSDSLSAKERRGLRKIAETFRQRGGVIRVEGHASSRTRDMDLVRHHLVNFNVSLNRANAVARELVRQGVSRGAVFIAAISDARPLYHEVMPAGDAGNQRVEIYFLN